MKKNSFGRRLLRWVTWSAAVVTGILFIGVFITYRGYQINEAKASLSDAVQLEPPKDSFTLEPVGFARLEEPKLISQGKRQSVAPVAHSTKAKQPTAAEKEAAARAAWIAKRDSLEAVEKWRTRLAAKPTVEQPVKKATAKKQQSQKRRTTSQPTNTKPKEISFPAGESAVRYTATDAQDNPHKKWNYRTAINEVSDLEKQAAEQVKRGGDLKEIKDAVDKLKNPPVHESGLIKLLRGQ